MSSISFAIFVICSDMAEQLSGQSAQLHQASLEQNQSTELEMERAGRSTSSMETTRTAMVDRMATNIAPLMKWL